MKFATFVAAVAVAAVLCMPQIVSAEVDCETPLECQFLCTAPPCMTGALYPAIQFVVTADQAVPFHIEISKGHGCMNPQMLDGMTTLTAGTWILYLNFDPPLPPGTMLSVAWQLDDCEQRDCADYTMGTTPGVCGAGASVDAIPLTLNLASNNKRGVWVKDAVLNASTFHKARLLASKTKELLPGVPVRTIGAGCHTSQELLALPAL